MHRPIALVATIATAAILIGIPEYLTAAEAPTSPVERVVGGEATATCAWPTTVFVRLPGILCSGTLIAPDIVVYAAHCGSDVQTIGFGENWDYPDITVTPSACYLYPNHSPWNGTDFAFCKLPQPLNNMPIVPVAMGCEVLAVRAQNEAVIVGFGKDDTGVIGIKRDSTVEQYGLDGTQPMLGGDGSSTCNGDSGGSAFVQLNNSDALPGVADNTWRVFGITSWGPTSPCGGTAHDSLISDAMPWIESTAGEDITPCTDADGTWNPGPNCGGFPLNPGGSGEQWVNSCEGGPIAGYSATCGAPYQRGPKVIINVPPANDLLDDSPPLHIGVTVQSNEVVSVTAQFDGTTLGTNESEETQRSFGPVALTLGQHRIQVTAVDPNGVSSQQTLPITVTNDTPDVGGGGGCSMGLQPSGCLVLGITALWVRRRFLTAILKSL